MISVSPCVEAPSLRIERIDRTEPKLDAFEVALAVGTAVAELVLFWRECDVGGLVEIDAEATCARPRMDGEGRSTGVSLRTLPPLCLLALARSSDAVAEWPICPCPRSAPNQPSSRSPRSRGSRMEREPFLRKSLAGFRRLGDGIGSPPPDEERRSGSGGGVRGGSGGGSGSTAIVAALVLVVPPCPRNRESGAIGGPAFGGSL
jgi:hypothetical protein